MDSFLFSLILTALLAMRLPVYAVGSPLTISCPANQTPQTYSCGGSTTSVTFPVATASGGTGTVSAPSYSSSPTGASFATTVNNQVTGTFPVTTSSVTYTITATVTDQASAFQQCTFTVTFNPADPGPPVCTSTNDITQTIPLGTGGTTVIWREPRADDNCGVLMLQSRSHAPGYFFSPGIHRINYIFIDGSENQLSCNFTIQIIEAGSLAVTCPSNTVITASPGQSGAVVTYEGTSAEEGSAPYTYTYSQQSGTFFNVGTTTVTVMVRDTTTAFATCTFEVTVNTAAAQVISTTDTTISIRLFNSKNYTEYQIRYYSDTDSPRLEAFDAEEELLVLKNLEPSKTYSIEIEGRTLESQLQTVAEVTASTTMSQNDTGSGSNTALIGGIVAGIIIIILVVVAAALLSFCKSRQL